MERKQLPSSFPETFNDFFTLINEDNDHIDLLTNFLEDKVIPHNKENNQLNNVNKRSNSFNTKSKINHSNYNNSNIKKYTTTNNNNKNNNSYNNNNNNNINRNKKFIYNNNNNYNNSYSIYSNYSYDNIKKSPINIKKFRSIDKMNLPSCSSAQQTIKCKKKFTKEIPTTSTYIEDDDDDDEEDDDEDDDDNDFINSINCYDKKMLGLGDNNKETLKQSHSSINDLYTNNIMMMMNSNSNENVASTSATAAAIASTSSAAINTPNKNNTKHKSNNDMIKNRLRTASMPIENRKPRLADTRRGAIHYSDMDDIEYYRLRSFSITSHGICNLGDSMRKRRSCSINSGTSSTGTINSDNMKQLKQQITDHEEQQQQFNNNGDNNVKNVYKVAMLGDSGVGKTALTIQFTTSEYICAYDLSLDDDYGQKTVSVLLNGNETNLEIIDHPECEMSVESFLSTYIIDIFVIVYSIIDRKTFKFAEKIINYLYDNNLMLTHGVILVGNKIDLERQREITQQNGKLLAKKFLCKFIETSSGLNHNVDELLVGIVAQVKLNKKRLINLTEKQRLNINKMNYLKKHQRSIDADGLCHDDSDKDDSDDDGAPTAVINYCDDDDVDDNGAAASTTKTFTTNTMTNDNNLINLTKRKSSNKLTQELAQMKTATANKSSKKMTTTATTNNTGNNCTTKLTNKTKLFLTTFMKFKNVLNVNRRNSNSCSDLFVI